MSGSPFHARLDAVARALVDAAEVWARKACEARFADDARLYADVSRSIAHVAGETYKLAVEWTPSMVQEGPFEAAYYTANTDGKPSCYGPVRDSLDEALEDARHHIMTSRWGTARVRNTRTGEFVTP